MKFDWLRHAAPRQAGMVILGLGLTGTALAADAWDPKHFNPKPADDDVILPMPCGGSMAFRKVNVPVAGPLDDFPIQVGQESEEWGFIEQSRPAFIAGSFTADEKGSNQSRYYLMSKYELTMLQYQALTSDKCPSPSNKLRLPATGLSWFEAMRVSNLYNVWLRQNAPQALPREDNVAGFVRLPTEVEWEFAARGGLKVSKAEFVDLRYPMPEGLNAYEWYGGAQSSNGKLQLAGLLQPNPLGLHDMLGNAEEITADSFRLNKLDRQHGQAGGYVVRGSHYLTPQDELRTAARREESYYDDKGELTKNTIGVRWVVAAPSLTSRERISRIEESWKGLGQNEATPDSTAKGPAAVKQLDTLLSNVEDKKLKEQLKDLQNKLRASNLQQEEARDQAIRASLNLGSFLCTKLKDDGVFLQMLQETYKTNCQTQTPDRTCPMREQRLNEQTDRLNKLTQYYASSLIDSAQLYGRPNLERQVPVMDRIFQDNAQLQGLRPYLASYWAHQQSYLKSKKADTQAWLNQCMSVSNP